MGVEVRMGAGPLKLQGDGSQLHSHQLSAGPPGSQPQVLSFPLASTFSSREERWREVVLLLSFVE